jgi:hypothetical protein
MTKFYILNLPTIKDGRTMPIYDTSSDYDKNGNIKSYKSELETGPTYIAYVPYAYYILNKVSYTFFYALLFLFVGFGFFFLVKFLIHML